MFGGTTDTMANSHFYLACSQNRQYHTSLFPLSSTEHLISSNEHQQEESTKFLFAIEFTREKNNSLFLCKVKPIANFGVFQVFHHRDKR